MEGRLNLSPSWAIVFFTCTLVFCCLESEQFELPELFALTSTTTEDGLFVGDEARTEVDVVVLAIKVEVVVRVVTRVVVIVVTRVATKLVTVDVVTLSFRLLYS